MMHYYKRNIGDYAKKAGRLSMLQHGSYTLLIDACYDRERFPTRDEAIDWTWASSSAEIEAVEFVLSKFFTLEGGVYVQTCIRDDLSGYHAKADTNKRIALERETKRKQNNTNREQAVNEPPPNQEPITNNQEPEEQKQKIKAKFTPPDKPGDVEDSVWTDFLALRKAKRSPLTSTALDAIQREAKKASITLSAALTECCSRGWQGFKADWLRTDQQHVAGPPGRHHETERDIRSRTRRELLEQINGTHNQRGAVSAFIDAEAIRVD